jgi:hypothetical protein
MCNHRLAVFSLRGRHIRHVGHFGDAPGEFRHPVGVALSADLLLVSEYTGGRLQVLSPTSGECLQLVRAPFEGACLGALGADARRVTVTDSADRLHCFAIRRRGVAAGAASEENDGEEEEGEEEGGPLHLAPVRDAAVENEARVEELRRTRAGRITLALEARDYRGVLESLTKDDVAALVPAANEHAVAHPELYRLPPVRAADDLVRDLELHLHGRAPPLGPPH